MDYDKIKYMHVEKFGSDEVSGIENYESYVLPKIDGTNGVIWFEDNVVHCGSRKRELSIESDNAGFYSQFHNDDRFTNFFHKYNTDRYFYVVYGEFLVKNVIKDYEDNAWRKYYVFDVLRYDKDTDTGTYLKPEEYIPMLKEFNIDYIPVMCKITNPTIEQLKDLCEKATFLMKEDKPGEGIVLHAPGFVNRYGRTVWAKVVRNEFRVSKKLGGHDTGSFDSVENKIIDNFLTTALINKEYAKIVVEKGVWDNKYIPRLFNTIFHTLITECAWDMVKKYKRPKIDFNKLYLLTVEKVKDTMKGVF